MFSIQLLGGASIRGENGALHGRMTHRHRLALLALLATSHPRSVARDRLVALLWPEAETERARKLLNQAVHALRKALGEHAILSVRDELQLVVGVVECDVIVFENAFKAGELERAVALYAGPFLDGFFLSDAPEFERWAERERERLRLAYCQALEGLAEEAAAREDWCPAAEWWRRLAVEEPYNSRVTLRLMQALEAAGDRAGALQQARVHALLLEEEFEAEPDPQVSALAERLRTMPIAPVESRLAQRGTRYNGPRRPAAPPPRPLDPTATRPRGTGAYLRRRRGAAAVAAAVLVLGVLGVSAVLFERRPPGSDLDLEVVAVLPFRVGGADPASGYLREGMVDLMAAMFAGDRGLRAVDPRSLLSSWRRAVGDATQDLPPDAESRLAAELGAGRMLVGEVASPPGQVVLTASLLDVSTGTPVASAVVSGPPDSLLVLVERLAVQLEARHAGEPEDRLPRLTSTSIAAVRAYLTGRAAYRGGENQRAYVELERAIALDSTFAIAALALLGSYVWSSGDAPVARAAALAWSLHDRLSARDRALLEGMVGPVPVETTGPATWFTGQLLEARRRAALAAPDTPEAWLMLGDALFHWGRFHAIEAWEERAEAALRRALELDSAFVAPLVHLVELAATRGDTAEVRARRNLYLARDSTGEQVEFIRWRSAIALGETPEFTYEPAQLERLPIESLVRMVTAVRTDAVGLDEAPYIARTLAARLSRAGEGVVDPRPAWGPLIAYTLDRGRPSEAVAFVERLAPHQKARAHVLNALYWDGDPSAAAHATEELARQARQELANRDPSARGLNGLCIWEQWRLAHGEVSTASRAIARLNATDYPGDQLCALILGALLALATDNARQAAAAEELESFLLGTGVLGGPSYEYANLVLARVHEARGDAHAALAALRRRGGRHPWGLYLSTYLREEGRLAAQVGDEGAVRAYRHYLALRSAPEPTLQSRVAQVREEFARLEQDRRWQRAQMALTPAPRRRPATAVTGP
jgi:DNA-binding SARP family transcriptional activator/TolB-like protein